MRIQLRPASAALLALPLSLASAQGPGKDLVMDFRTSTTVEGLPQSGLITGNIVGSGSKLRIDMTTTGGNSPTPMPTDGPVSMIVSDSGKTITYLDAKNKQYIRFRPGDMLAQAQQMGGMKMEFSGTEAKVDNLGAGPRILGHPTSHYRVGTSMTMTISAMGQQQSVKIASTTEYYFPTDIKSAINPFASMTGTDMVTMFGASNKEFADKMKAAQDKLPKSPPFRTSTTATVTTQGVSKITRSNTEVTSVKWVNSDPKVFEIPAGYTAAEMPGLGQGENPPPSQ